MMNYPGMVVVSVTTEVITEGEVKKLRQTTISEVVVDDETTLRQLSNLENRKKALSSDLVAVDEDKAFLKKLLDDAEVAV